MRQRRGATDAELQRTRTDVLTGMFFSNLVMYFIILTTAATLHAHGETHIETARQAAEALRPLAGAGAYWLFTLGLIGTGMLGRAGPGRVVRLRGRGGGGLARLPRRHAAPRAALLRGGGGRDAGRAGPELRGASTRSRCCSGRRSSTGCSRAPLIVLVVLLTSDRAVMGKRVNPPLLRWLGWATAVIMTAATVGMLVTL